MSRARKLTAANPSSEPMLIIRQGDYNSMRCHGEETYPDECCGVLLGTVENGRRRIARCVPCNNIRGDRLRDRYEIDPRRLVAIQREARGDSLDIVGFYHSHPDHPAHWSQTDLDQAYWFGCSYVITSVEQGRAAITRSFVLEGTPSGIEERHFVQEEIQVDIPASLLGTS